MSSQRSAAPWERQPNESAKAFAAFLIYRDMPAHERSLSKLSLERSTYVPRWSRRYSWVKRAAAWDDEQDRIARQARAEEVQEMNRRHIQIAMGMIGKAATRLNSLLPNELTPSELRQYFADAVKLERLARGEADSILDQRGTQTVIVRYEDEELTGDGDSDAAFD